MVITKIISSLVLLTMLSGCFGQTLFSIGPIPIKPGDLVSSPIKKEIFTKNTKKLVAKQPEK